MTPLALVFAYLLAAQETPSASDLIDTAVAARKAQEARGWKYTYRMDRDEANSRKTYEVVMLESSPYSRLILIDGKPPDAKTQKKIDAAMESERLRRRGPRSLVSVTRTLTFGDLKNLERLFDNKVAGLDTVGGRPAWRVESEPRNGYHATDKTEEQILSLRRTTWFDRESGVEIKHRYRLFRDIAGFHAGSWFELEYAKVGEDFLLAEETQHVDMKIVATIHGRGETHYRYYDYKRFAADSRLTP